MDTYTEDIRMSARVTDEVRVVAEAMPAPLGVGSEMDEIAAVATVAPVCPALASVMPGSLVSVRALACVVCGLCVRARLFVSPSPPLTSEWA